VCCVRVVGVATRTRTNALDDAAVHLSRVKRLGVL
jgi:hypothetical protein